jgi:hypothetical protein
MDAIGAYPHRMSDTERRACLRRAVIASTVGTTIEWYDFLIYSVVTGLVFGNLYFPDADPVVGRVEGLRSVLCRLYRAADRTGDFRALR